MSFHSLMGREMESDDLSNCQLVEAKLGLDKGLPQTSLKPRAKKMGVKDCSKSVAVSVESDDNEPIGSLFKLKRPRNPKKGRAKQEKLVDGDDGEEFGGMDDTLASFRKKLKGPKKDFGSVSAAAEKGYGESEDLLDAGVDIGVQSKRKEKVRRGEIDGKRTRIGGDDDLGSHGDLGEAQRGEGLFCMEGSSKSLDHKFSDSLSVLFQKKQSGLSRKSRPNLITKLNNGETLESGKVISTVRSVSEPKVACKDLKGESSHVATAFRHFDHASEENKTPKTETLVNGVFRETEFDDESMMDPCVSNVKEEPVVDPCSSHKVCSKNCSSSSQVECSETQNLENGSKPCSMGKEFVTGHDSMVMPNSGHASMPVEVICSTVDSKSAKKFRDALDKQSEDVSAVRISKEPPTSFSLSGREILANSFDDQLSEKSCRNPSDEINKLAQEKMSDGSSKSLFSHSASHDLKMDRAAKTEDGIDFDQCPNPSRLAQPHLPDLALVSPKIEKNCNDDDISNTHTEEQGAYGHPNAFIQKCSSVLHENHQISVVSHDHPFITDEANGVSPPSTTPEENESYAEDSVSVPDYEIKDVKLSTVERVVRKVKKRRLGDMAYEGDADWEILINEQQFLESDHVVECDQSFRVREKSDSSPFSPTEADNGGTAAVSAGLKAHAAGPVEKIKFKEVLKRKGGLQEYMECRNRILSLWSKDVSRILPLADCGVLDTPSEDESPRTSLMRQIYSFLDQSGYINVGIASEKESVELEAKHNYTLFEDKKSEGNHEDSVVDLEDGVSFILGQVKSCETSLEANKGVSISDEILAFETTKNPELVELSNVVEHEESLVDVQQGGMNDIKLPNRLGNFDGLIADPFCEIPDSRSVPVASPESRNDLQSIQSKSCDGGTNGKKIIVIGAGPAGLTAARHLQRQGFAVTVLEARNRTGGRVYTDRSSLSVPVDLGASIITGVEADVATGRRPDPSSLICAQLGLELTVLNSDCPLHDIVTGEKVPADLDEELEAEYNCLLDDMFLVITQKGEHAMKMSLDDGLEYALKSRRMMLSGTNIDEAELGDGAGTLYDSKTYGVDGGVLERSCKEDILGPLERRVMDWHFAHLEYGCAASLKDVSLPYWNQDDVYGGFGGAHCMIKGGYSRVTESLGRGLNIHLNHVVTDISYGPKETGASESQCNKVKVSTSNGSAFMGDAVLVTVPLGCLKAEAIKFFPPLPQWKRSSIQRLGYGVLNKVVLEFPEVFWDDSVDYFGATAEESGQRGHCFMFWNVRKTVGAPVLIALVVGKAAIEGQSMSSSDHVSHAIMVLRKLFGESLVPDPVASVVTDWGRDPFSYGAYSYVAIGSSGEDYDMLGRPVENCLFFAGEATCKEHPDTVGGAMMSGLREAVRIIDILSTGNDYSAEIEAMEAIERHSECERDEVRDITKRLEAVELSNVLYKNSLERARFLTREALLKDMFFSTKTTAGRLHLAKKLLNLPVETLKSFAGTRRGLTTLNSWILDSMGKDGTQLLRHCVRLLVLVSTDLLAVRLSGIGKTVKEKVCVHTSRDIRAIASQLVSVWLEVFRRVKASKRRLKLSRQAAAVDSRKKSLNNSSYGKPPLRSQHGGFENKGNLQVSSSTGSPLPSNVNMKKVNGKLEGIKETKLDAESELNYTVVISEEEKAAIAAAEAARAAAKAYASSEAKCNTALQLPKIPSFHKFARREQYAQMDEYDLRRKWSGGVLGRQDCISEIDSRNCRVRDWSVDFSATCANLDSSRVSVENFSQQSHSNEIACQMNFGEQSGESAAVDNTLFTKAWVDSDGTGGIKDHHAIERWQCQAAAADSDFYLSAMHIRDEEDSNTSSKQPTWKQDVRANESSTSQVTINKERHKNHHRGADRIKQAVVDFVASLLMPVYKARKIDKEGYKSIMKKSATKVMELATDAEKHMGVSEFLDFKRKNKIRAFVDKLIERHMTKSSSKP